MFSQLIQKHFCCRQCFLASPNVSSTRNIVFPFWHVQTMFKDYSSNINNTLRFMRANVSQKMFPSLSTLGNMSKHRQETMFLQQCFLVCQRLIDNVLLILSIKYFNFYCMATYHHLKILHTNLGFDQDRDFYSDFLIVCNHVMMIFFHQYLHPTCWCKI